MVKKLFFLVSAYFILFNSYGQGVLKFNSDKHDFGLIEEGTTATYEFEFTNVGKDTILLTDVKASCGCTTPYWTKDPIAPGGKGSIKASYSSAGRPGVFTKTITVSSNATEPSKMLIIKGVVEKKEEKPVYTEAELKSSPKAEIEKTSYAFGKIERGQKVVAKINLKNTGKESLTILGVQAACNCVSHSFPAGSVGSGKTETIEFTYGPYHDGENSDIVIITTNDKNNPKITINFTAEVVESLQQKSLLMEDNSKIPFGK
ncbi:MAG TPA: DUF1573 domain-containing protein [Cytophagaceae bacterium]